MESLYPWIVASLIFSFFFSGIEIAFLSANRLQIELQGKQGVWSGRIIAFFMQNIAKAHHFRLEKPLLWSIFRPSKDA